MEIKVVSKSDYIKEHGPLAIRGVRWEHAEEIREKVISMEIGAFLPIPLDEGRSGTKALNALHRQVHNCLHPFVNKMDFKLSIFTNKTAKHVAIHKLKKRTSADKAARASEKQK